MFTRVNFISLFKLDRAQNISTEYCLIKESVRLNRQSMSKSKNGVKAIIADKMLILVMQL